MDHLMSRLKMMVANDDVDQNFVTKDFAMNPYRQLIHEIMLDRKELLRSKLNVVSLFDQEEPSSEIEEILVNKQAKHFSIKSTVQEQFTNPTFPLEEINTEKDEEWQPLERKYLDGVNNIKHEMMMKQMQLDKDMERAVCRQQEVLRSQQEVRPIDDRDFCNSRMCIERKFEQTKMSLRGEAATKILVLRRDIEQQGRKRRNFDKNTTDILQNWFHEHRQNPYPSDQEKADLAKQCNIKISQVNNWFGNQRIRTRQQTMKMKEEEERERATHAALADQAHLMSDNSQSAGMMMNSQMQTMVIPARSHQQNIMENHQGFLQQPHYFQSGGQMPHTDNGNGQQFYNEFDTFSLIPSDPDHFNGMQY
uniref:Homeobox domain-containing protein n=1 Tax=Caenorhabditis japonica TaxID=281687 RepID=A0A8R1HL05_CAEJA